MPVEAELEKNKGVVYVADMLGAEKEVSVFSMAHDDSLDPNPSQQSHSKLYSFRKSTE